MKIHITNLYNFNPNDELVKKQHRIAEAGRKMGYREMGIFSYPVETDSSTELSKRLDGIIAALEADDVVFFQLPTRNGVNYEKLLLQKIKAYHNTKLILIIHDMKLFEASKEVKEAYREMCELAEVVLVPTERDVLRVQAFDIAAVIPLELDQNDFGIQKACMDAVEAAFTPQNTVYHKNRNSRDGEIHIGFGLHDKTGNYSVWVGVAIQSVIEHTNAPLCFHILHDDTLSRKNKNKLIQTATQKGNRIFFHESDPSRWKEAQERMGRYTIGAMFRILLPEILSDVSKIIYLDADVLVYRDIKELWELDVHDYCLAAVPDHPTVNGQGKPYPVAQNVVLASHYFNSGVLCMNLERIRAKGSMYEKVMDYLVQNPEASLPDQDALNVIYGKETYLLDETWNTFTTAIWTKPETPMEKRIYHFAVSQLILYSLSELDKAYYETLCRTPWGVCESRTQIHKSFSSIGKRISELEHVAMQLSKTNTKHVFYGQESYAMRNLYDVLSIREGDYRVLAEVTEDTDSILPCSPFLTLVNEKHRFVVFVLPEADYWTSIDRLEAMGLKKDQDYFVIPRLLPPNRGGYV